MSVKVIRVPRLPSVSRAGARRFARRVGGAALQTARDEKHTLFAAGAAAALGYLEKQGQSLPKIEALGTAGTYGVAAWLAAKYTHNRSLRHVATGLLSVAAYKLGKGEGVAGDDDDDSSGGY